MKTKLLLALLVPALYVVSSCDDPKKANNYNQETTVDQSAFNFIKTAIDGSRTEVKLSAAAARISQNPRIVRFAKMMITDHTKGIEELKAIRKKELINPNDALSIEHKELIDSLSKLSGTDFDKAYMAAMVADHEKTVDLFREETQERAPSVQSFARKTLPTIEMHLDSAKAIATTLR
jgi:putative membrane protein